MRFRLTFEGMLYGAGRATHKHVLEPGVLPKTLQLQMEGLARFAARPEHFASKR